MLAFPAPFAAALGERVASLTVCWAVTRSDGIVIRGTAHDRALKIDDGPLAGTYKTRTAIFATDVRSTSDGSVSNVEAEGAFRLDAIADEDITPEEVEGGLYDQARAVLFLVDWQQPNAGQRILVSGTLGEFRRDSDGRYRSEVRGLTQALSQQILGSASSMCDVKVFGDSRCKFDLGPHTVQGEVVAVTNRKRFQAERTRFPIPTIPTPVYYVHALLKFTSGRNAGVTREVRVAHVPDITGPFFDNAEILLSDEMPYDIEVGDTFELPPGCDRQYATCRWIHDNIINFRGYGLYATGRDALMRGIGDATGKRRTITDAEEDQQRLRELLEDMAERLLTLMAAP